MEAWRSSKNARREKVSQRFDVIPWEVIGPYAAKDAELTLRLHQLQTFRLDAGLDWLRPWVRIENEIAALISKMTHRGLPLDVQLCRKALAECEHLVQQSAARLDFEPTPAAAADYFYNREARRPHCVTLKTAKRSVKECCVRDLIKQGSEQAVEYQIYSKLSSLQNRYYSAFLRLVGSDGRLRTDLRPDGTITGRFRSTRVNLQALPHDFRYDLGGGVRELPHPKQLFRAPAGSRGWELDLSQAEIRVSAMVAKELNMLEAVKAGDPHGDTARRMFHVERGDLDWDKYRQIGKTCNFSLIFGAGAETYRDYLRRTSDFIFSLAECRQIVQDYRSIYPMYPRAIHRFSRQAQYRGYVELIDGFKRFWPANEQTHKAFNAVVQGSISAILKRTMLHVEQRWPGILINNVHDSIVLECDEDFDVEPVRLSFVEIASEMVGMGMDVDCKPGLKGMDG